MATRKAAQPIPRREAMLRNVLERLTEKVERANNIRHSGGRLVAADWSELYQITNEARGVLKETE